MPHTVLIVDADSHARADTAKTLSDAGYLVTMASSFDEAKRHLALAEPDLLMADVRLGSYNGLHLVVRSRSDFPKIAAIVTHAVRDPVLQGEAAAFNAVYLVKPLDPEKLLSVVRGLLRGRPERTSTTVRRRWPRKTVRRGSVASMGAARATVIDLSYGGLRLEMGEAVEGELGSSQEVHLPGVGLSLRGRPVWVRRVGPAGPWWCGVDLNEADASAIGAWRDFVDAAI